MTGWYYHNGTHSPLLRPCALIRFSNKDRTRARFAIIQPAGWANGRHKKLHARQIFHSADPELIWPAAGSNKVANLPILRPDLFPKKEPANG